MRVYCRGEHRTDHIKGVINCKKNLSKTYIQQFHNQFQSNLMAAIQRQQSIRQNYQLYRQQNSLTHLNNNNNPNNTPSVRSIIYVDDDDNVNENKNISKNNKYNNNNKDMIHFIPLSSFQQLNLHDDNDKNELYKKNAYKKK